MSHTFLIVLAILIGLVGLFTLGLVIPPRPYRRHPAPSRPGEALPLYPDLPEPVRRHFAETIGSNPQEMETMVVWGRGRAKIRGVWVPLRFKGWYDSGDAFLRRMEVTWFQRPVMRGSDSWINGQGLYVMGEKVESGERIDQSQVLTLWADTVWMPSVYVHDQRIRWFPVDDHTARLEVPYKGGTESLDAHFSPVNGRMTHFTAMRYSADEDSPEKEPWRVDLLEWKEFDGLMLPSHIDVAWGESGAPTSYWMVDGIAYNVNISAQLGERLVPKKRKRRSKEVEP